MPLAKIHVVEGRYDDGRIAKVSGAIQAALMNTLRVASSRRASSLKSFLPYEMLSIERSQVSTEGRQPSRVDF
jgi:hypothetical protein